MITLQGLGKRIARRLGRRRNPDCAEYRRPREASRPAELRRRLDGLARPARFSILLRLDGRAKAALLEDTLDSLAEQIYPGWELHLVAPGGKADLQALNLATLPASLCPDTDACLRSAGGDYVIPMRAGDRLAPAALAELALYLERFPDQDLVYSDETEVEPAGRKQQPRCKPDWSPDLLLSHHYIGRLAAFRRDALIQAGGFGAEGDLADDLDLALRFTAATRAVGHLPLRLYYRRADGSAPDARALQATVERALQRRGWSARVAPAPGRSGLACTHWPPVGRPLISILICTHDRADLLERCLGSIYARSSYDHFEVILVDNASREPATRELIQRWKQQEPERFREIRLDVPFNFSLLNNRAAAEARGELLLFLNNDTEVVTPEWLEELAGQTQRPEVGAASALLLFPDGRVQHAGILVGGRDLAVHAYRGLPADAPDGPVRLAVPSSFPALTGACLMLRKETFHSLGGLKEELAVSYGDVDLCLRLKRAGYYNVLLPHVRLIHHESATRGYEITREKRERLRSEARILQEHWPELRNPDFFLTA